MFIKISWNFPRQLVCFSNLFYHSLADQSVATLTRDMEFGMQNDEPTSSLFNQLLFDKHKLPIDVSNTPCELKMSRLEDAGFIQKLGVKNRQSSWALSGNSDAPGTLGKVLPSPGEIS